MWKERSSFGYVRHHTTYPFTLFSLILPSPHSCIYPISCVEPNRVSQPQRILTTPLLFTLFLLLTILTALCLTTAALLALGAAYDLTPFWGLAKLTMRGTGLEAMWVALVGGWTGLAGILFVSCVCDS